MELTRALQDAGVPVSAGNAETPVDGQAAGCVARPEHVEQVAATLRAAHAAGASVVALGTGTKQDLGAVVPAPDLVLDLSRMDALLTHEPGDLIVQVQAGMPLARLQRELATHSQQLLLDDPFGASTVGGVIATNTSGPRRLRAGTARDLLIGATIVLPEGTVAHTGGKVVKNVAGYDLAKLVVGSFGTLAVVVEATLRLHPLPVRSTWVAAEVPDAELESTLSRACDAQVAPSAIELDWAPDRSPVVAVLLEGTPEGVSGRVEATRPLLGSGSAEHAELDWPWRHPVAAGDDRVVFKLTCRLGRVAALARTAHDLGLAVRGSAGAGVLYAAADAGRDDLAAVLAALRARTSAAGGSAVVLSGPRSVRATLDVWGPVTGLPVMRRVKEQFDPYGTLSPGRFVGGI